MFIEMEFALTGYTQSDFVRRYQSENKIQFFCRALLLAKERLYFSPCDVIRLSVHPWQDRGPPRGGGGGGAAGALWSKKHVQ